MAKVMVALDWELVSVVHSDDTLGENSLKMFREVASAYRICIHQTLSVNELHELGGPDTPRGIVYLGTAGAGLLEVFE